tara:strand:- start:1796 stop:2218 length:423 start_codon:yes stop_codon:yes gene_type:complete
MSEQTQKSAIASVAKVIDEFTVVINRGRGDGIAVGSRFLIFGIGDEIIDPETGKSLGQLELVKGIGTVTHVQDAMSTLQSSKTKKPAPVVRTTTKKNPYGSIGIASLLGGMSEETQEEHTGEPISLPFNDPQVGDRARPI